MSLDVNGRVALVTGAAQGIGLATARALHARGARVAVVDLEQAAADAAAASLGESAIGLAADVTDRAAIGRAVEATVERFGGLDVVVANAGVAPAPATTRVMDEAEFERVVEVDLLGVYRTVRAALPHVVARRGNVTVVASVYAFTNGLGAAPYAMAKAGVEQFGRALRAELAAHGVSVTTAYFGFIDTAMVQEGFDRSPVQAELEAAIPPPLLKRLPPSAAGEGIVRAIERGRARVILPRRWAALSVLRGVVGPLTDAAAVRDRRVRALLARIDGRAA
jgi:NAD(P)-dependent dehydrogenase (short-subunit alcohol dehydrogenase family)